MARFRLLSRLLSRLAYDRFQRASRAQEASAQQRHAPTRDILARRQATLHAALRGRA